MPQTILVTGGAGYIGSHTCVELLERGYSVVILDNLCNSKREVVRRIAAIAGRAPMFIEGDARDGALLARIFAQHKPHAVVHFAGLKAVGESVAKPLLYYDNNVGSTLRILEAMQASACRRLVFSSSATVYGEPDAVPLIESAPLRPENPYGRTKLMVEDILRDLASSEKGWHFALLRYFNPVGAHASGMIGEDPSGIPNNLMPYVTQVAVGRRERLTIFGSDYDTRDGTGERDYIHVLDLAAGHVAAIERIDSLDGAVAINLGTGRGTTVLELVAAFGRASGAPIPYTLGARRAGDVASYFADPGYARTVLGWQAKLDVERMCADSWRWQSNNAEGYPED